MGIDERNNDGKPSSVVVVCSLHRIVRDHNGMNIFDRINCSYDHELSFGGYRMRQISTRICLSREHFGEAIFSLMKKTPTPFHKSFPVCIKQIMADKSSSAVVCYFQILFTIKWKKNCQID